MSAYLAPIVVIGLIVVAAFVFRLFDREQAARDQRDRRLMAELRRLEVDQ